MCVVGVDSVVVEGWSSGFVVGLEAPHCFAPPSGGAFAGGAVSFHFTAAVAAWPVL